MGGTIYVNNQPISVLTPEGRLLPGDNAQWQPEYHLKDHLGNTRAVVAGTLLPGAADVIQTTAYYPFGLVMVQNNANTLLPNTHTNRYLYNGKELQTEGSESVELGWLDYGARMYDAQLGRFHTVDPLAEITYRWTPFRYGFNNPLRFIDKDGFTEEERIRAIQYARDKINTPYSKLDCSALVAASIVSAGISNPKVGGGIDGWGNGVALIASNVRISSAGNIRSGDAVTFNSGRSPSNGPNGIYDHIGIVSDLVYKGNKVIGFKVIHATSSKGVKEQYYDFEEGMPGFELRGVFQWDTPDESEVSKNEGSNGKGFNIPQYIRDAYPGATDSQLLIIYKALNYKNSIERRYDSDGRIILDNLPKPDGLSDEGWKNLKIWTRRVDPDVK